MACRSLLLLLLSSNATPPPDTAGQSITRLLTAPRPRASLMPRLTWSGAVPLTKVALAVGRSPGLGSHSQHPAPSYFIVVSETEERRLRSRRQTSGIGLGNSMFCYKEEIGWAKQRGLLWSAALSQWQVEKGRQNMPLSEPLLASAAVACVTGAPDLFAGGQS
ncbi:hypothetical protein B0H63DRAFT_184609 [Podospora didyma]|uniref:Uncharacterized protein n=1 Tax=Podospora didyma TaxID=330526 RepID=A0AAE0TZT7_9PEZI|nr:hypothetical protein B0H63DRAFT_184609 [Podospora didyma]